MFRGPPSRAEANSTRSPSGVQAGHWSRLASNVSRVRVSRAKSQIQTSLSWSRARQARPACRRGDAWIEVGAWDSRDRFFPTFPIDPDEGILKATPTSAQRIHESPVAGDTEVGRAAALDDDPLEQRHGVARDLESFGVERHRPHRAILGGIDEVPRRDVVGTDAREAEPRHVSRGEVENGELTARPSGRVDRPRAGPRVRRGRTLPR